MTNLAGLELRRAACEVVGWRIVRGGEYRRLHSPSQPTSFVIWGPTDQSREHLWAAAPAIESDPAVSEPMFLEWCEKNALCFELFGPIKHPHMPRLDGMFGCRLAKWIDEYYAPQLEAYGSTPSEARARAIVAAGKQTKGENK